MKENNVSLGNANANRWQHGQLGSKLTSDDDIDEEQDQDWDNCCPNDEDCDKRSIVSNVNSIISTIIEKQNLLRL